MKHGEPGSHFIRALYLHIGLPKTGTSFWAKSVLSRLENVVLLHAQQGLPVSRKLGRSLKRASRPEPRDIRFAADTLNALFDTNDKDIVLSNENITIQRNGFWEGIGSSPEHLADHICALREELNGMAIRVILGTRRQDYWLASRYAQSARTLQEAGQEDFNRRVSEICARSTLLGPMEWLLFQSAHKTLADAIGRRNVLVVPMESLETAPHSAVITLGQFIGGRDLASLVQDLEARGRLRRKENQRRLDGLQWKMSGSDATISLSSAQSKAILARFKEH